MSENWYLELTMAVGKLEDCRVDCLTVVCWVVRFVLNCLQWETEGLNSDWCHFGGIMLECVNSNSSTVTWNGTIRWTPCSALRELPTKGTPLIVPTLMYDCLLSRSVRAATAACGQKVFKHEPRRIFGSQFQNSVVPVRAGPAIYTTAQSFNIPTVHSFRPIWSTLDWCSSWHLKPNGHYMCHSN